MTAPIVTTVTLATVRDIKATGDRAAILVEYDIDETDGPTVHVDIKVNAQFTDAADGIETTGQILHHIAHALLSPNGTLLDLTAPASGERP